MKQRSLETNTSWLGRSTPKLIPYKAEEEEGCKDCKGDGYSTWVGSCTQHRNGTKAGGQSGGHAWVACMPHAIDWSKD